MHCGEFASARQYLDFGAETTVGGVDHDDLPVPMSHFVLHRHLRHILSRRLPRATVAGLKIPLFEVSRHVPYVDYNNAYVGMVCCIACST